MKIIRDPVHEYIPLSDREVRVIDTPFLQRLRHVAQNGPTRLVYPSLLGTRFEHSLGVMHLAGKVMQTILDPTTYEDNPALLRQFLAQARKDLRSFLGDKVPMRKGDQVRQTLCDIMRMSALFHDCGQLPLSHTLEEPFDTVYRAAAFPSYSKIKTHELLGAELVRSEMFDKQGIDCPPWLRRAVLLVLLAGSVPAKSRKGHLLGNSVFYTMKTILAGDHDVDRADYLLRDGHMSGVGFGKYDVERFVSSMRLCRIQDRFEVMPTSKAMSTVESALIERYKLYKWVYYHHKVLVFCDLVGKIAIRIFRRKAVKRSLFQKDTTSPAIDFEVYANKVAKSLGNLRSKIPPLRLYKGDKIFGPRDRKLYHVNLDFFFQTETGFLDDIWYCSAFRKIPDAGETGLCKEAVVNRRPVVHTVWKDSSEFQTCMSECHRQMKQSKEFRSLIREPVSEERVKSFLGNLWKHVKDVSSGQDISRFKEALIEEMEKATSKKLRKRIRRRQVQIIVKISDWNLVGNLANLQVVGRTGEPEQITKWSLLLGKVSELPGEIPFFVYVLGKTELIRYIRLQKRSRIIGFVADGLVVALIALFKHQDSAIKGICEKAWQKAG